MKETPVKNKVAQGARDSSVASGLAYILAVVLNKHAPEISTEAAMLVLVPLLGALSRLLFNHMKYKSGPPPAGLILLLLFPTFLGCARNTNSFNIGGTGMYIQTPLGMIALGNIEAHVATSELSDEQLTVTDTKYFEGSGTMAGEAGSALNTQRSYSMTIAPVAVEGENVTAPPYLTDEAEETEK